MDTATLPIGRPEGATIGAVWMQPIEEIFGWHSIELAVPQSEWDEASKNEQRWLRRWDDVLTEKRDDMHYEGVVESLRSNGWVRPVTVQWEEDEECLKYGDGHHRLAAAIDLGMTHIPVQLAGPAWADCVSDDSGSWRGGDYIREENRLTSADSSRSSSW